jgi:NAD(P)-dependent dehydrogenase (short-subunit alcohol dehydrogenase family)
LNAPRTTRVDGAVAVVTGGARGIGRATASALAEAGAVS